ncbi:TnsA endonuclease C-terminal domain-containing protein [Vibrio sp. VB16]|uniref:TnsA endonuclease C-terminal domain-containing protein n=1 Tax=Vibrio sp. VB16 TaxID=2785746 RepID=UPI0018A10F80|nr:TnsA endonuclease C-terminal domain-containing protein [Vibrio sp. VB16]UGA56945.1 TnsA endonuclease C-terminal domain-containing protein [Vibrio sp. VB16]
MTTTIQASITNREFKRIRNLQNQISNGSTRLFEMDNFSKASPLSHILLSHKTNRYHQLFTLEELALFLHLEHERNVLYIKEHYLLPCEQTLQCHTQLSSYHHNESRVVEAESHLGITTDFVIIEYDELRDSLYQQAFKCVPSDEHRNTVYSSDDAIRLHHRNEIERSYWEKQNIGVIQVTEKDLNPIKTSNLRWLRETYHHVRNLDVEEYLSKNITMTLHERFLTLPTATLEEHLSHAASVHKVSIPDVLDTFKHAAYSDLIPIDLNKIIELYSPVTMIPYPHHIE